MSVEGGCADASDRVKLPGLCKAPRTVPGTWGAHTMAANIRCLNPSLGGDGSAFGQLILQCDRDHVQQDVGLGVPAVAQ